MKSPMLPLLVSALGISSATAFDVHEWGTFTTVSGSDGILLDGLQREEESLPAFVHSHFGFENGQLSAAETVARLFAAHGKLWVQDGPSISKGIGKRPVSGVNVKMETPVIYFHSDKAVNATVKVGFNGGTISQWYPERSAGEKLPEPPAASDPRLEPTPSEAWRIDFAKGYQGSIEWKVDVLSPAESREALLFKPRDTVNWMRARVPEANALKAAGGEIENYLFYRGLGRIANGLGTLIDDRETLRLRNETGDAVPYVMVFERINGVTRWHAIDRGIEPGASVEVPEKLLTTESAEFPGAVYRSIHTGLVRQGLLPSEAAAMVQTWWSSYFETEGLRVFWVVPRRVTDGILPLEITPQPGNLIRVIVGRSEVLRPRREAEFLVRSRREGDQANEWKWFISVDRFGLAYQQRVAALTLRPTAAGQSLTAPSALNIPR